MRLPEKPKKPMLDLSRYMILVYGSKKIGKTMLCSQFPDVLFLTTEPGTKGMEIYEVETNDWETVLEAVDALEKEPDRFKTVAIDTADRFYDYCMDYVCLERGIEYPGTDEDGEADYGKSWRAVKQEFTSVINRILITGRGIIFTSHAKETTIRSKGGLKYDRIVPSMGSQARGVIEALVDIVLYAEYFRAKNTDGSPGATVKVLICQGDETVWAGTRKTAGKFPELLPLKLDGKEGYNTLARAFKGEDAGLNPQTLAPAQQTTEGAKNRLKDLKKKSREGGSELRKPEPKRQPVVKKKPAVKKIKK